MFYDNDPSADLWLSARKHTASLTQSQNTTPFRVRVMSLRGGPTRWLTQIDPGALATDRTIILDLNKYRPGADLKALKEECGIKHVILRIGGPLYFQIGNWQLTVDPTYRKYFDQARALGMTIGGYIVYSAGIDEQDYANSEILLDFLHQAMGGGAYKPDYVIVDDEVNYWYDGSRKITATAVNQVKGLKYLMPKIWRYHKLVPMEYSAQWFMRQTTDYYNEYRTWLDNVNNTPEGKTVMTWFAWYLSIFQDGTKVYDKMDSAISDIPEYSLESINNYLTIGSYSLYDIHQFTSKFLTPFVKDDNGNMQGVDASITRKSAQLFFKDLNIDITPADTTAPTVPYGLSAQNVTSTSIDLVWLPSTDNSAVIGYSVFMNGNQIATTPVAKYVATAQPGTTYTFSVDAFDAAGNHSTVSPTINVTTPAVTGSGCKTTLFNR